MKSEKISFVTNATTREAMAYVMLYSWVFVRNIARAVNRAAHKLPWLFVFATATLAFIISYISIGQARSERDSYNKKLVQTSMQLDSYKAVYGNGKEVH